MLIKQDKTYSEITELILNNLPFGVDIIDEDYNIVWMNKAFLDVFKEESIGKKCFEVYKDNKKQCDQCPLRNPIEVGQTKKIKTIGVAGGSIYEISHTGIEIKSKKYILEFFNDVTLYKEAMDDLSEARNTYETIFDQSSDGILGADPESRKFMIANESICKMLEYPKNELLQLSLKDICRKEDFASISEEFIKQTKKGAKTVENLPLLTKTGKVIHCDIHSGNVFFGRREILVGFFKKRE